MTTDSTNTSPLSALFTPYTDEAMAADKAEAERNSSGQRTINLSKLDPGSYDYRFLPPRPGQRSMFLIRHTHFVKGGEAIRAVACAKMGNGGRCLVCEEIERLEATGAPQDASIAKDLAANFSVQAVVLDLALPFDPVQPLGQIALVEFKKQVHTGLLAIRANTRSAGDFTHPMTGFAVTITKKGSGMNTDYTVAPSMAQPRGLMAPTEAAAIAILSGAPDIFDVKWPSDDEVATILQEAGLGVDGGAAPPARGGAGAHLGGNYGRQR